MAEMMFKVYLRSNNFVKEIRRFNLYANANFDAFHAKLLMMFPILKNKNFTVSWDDGPDKVLISTDEEFRIANREMISIKKINIDIESQENESQNMGENVNTEEVIHFGITCDGCNCNIVGFRYKCVECADFDLCSKCEAAKKHPDHHMLRMPQPLDWHKNRRFFHHLGKCLRKSGIERENKKMRCEDRMRDVSETVHRHMQPWIPYLNNFIDSLIEVHIPDDNSSKTQQTEKGQTSNEQATTNKNESENVSKKPSGEEKDDKGSQSDTSSVASQASPMAQSNAPEEWTMVDNTETSEVIEMPSTSTGVSTSVQQISTTSVAPSAPSALGETYTTSNVYPELPKEKAIYHPDPNIHNAIEAMIRMGFSNQGGLLTYLLSHEKGDINRVLEILQPTNK